MSKSNIEKVIEKILFDDQALSKFLACKDQNDLYKYCLNKGSGYTREEFDEFVEETIVKANKEKEVVASSLNLKKEIFDFLIAKANKEVVASSLKDVGGSQASHGISKKIRQAFTKALAAGLAVFSAVPMVQNFVPEVEALETSETVENITEDAIYEDLDTSLSQEETIDEVLSDEENMKGEISPEKDLNPNEEDIKDEVLPEEDLNSNEAGNKYKTREGLNKNILAKGSSSSKKWIKNNKFTRGLNIAAAAFGIYNIIQGQQKYESAISYNPKTREINGQSITDFVNKGLNGVSLDEGSCKLTNVRDGKDDTNPLSNKALELKNNLFKYCCRLVEVYCILVDFFLSVTDYDQNLIDSLLECNSLYMKFCTIAFDLNCFVESSCEYFIIIVDHDESYILVNKINSDVILLNKYALKLSTARTNQKLRGCLRNEYFKQD